MEWALVTGASAGIGLEFAKILSEKGVSLVLVARRRERLEQLAAEIMKAHTSVRVETIALDLSKAESAAKVETFISEKNIELTYLINNAGFGSSGAFNGLDLSKELEMVDLNIRSLVELTGRFLPGMVKRGRGRILNVGSTAGFQPGPYMATYYATKAFVNSFSEALTSEMKNTGVTVTALAPGPVATEFGNVSGADGSKLFAQTAAGARDVAQYGYDSMMKGRTLAVHGLKFKLLVQSLRVSPRYFVREAVGALNRSKG